MANPTRKVVFRLKRIWRASVSGETMEPYAEIKSGKKTIEYRKPSPYWLKRLIAGTIEGTIRQPIDLTKRLVVQRAWFTVGIPKNNLPRLEADITKLILDPLPNQLQIHIANVEEITQNCGKEKAWRPILDKYKAFHDHIQAHFEEEHPDWKVACKICGKDIDEIWRNFKESTKITLKPGPR